MVLLLRAAHYYPKNPNGPKKDFFVYAFHKAGAQYGSAFGPHFPEVPSHNQSLIASSGFDNSFDFKIPLSNFSNSRSMFWLSSQTGCVCFSGFKASSWSSLSMITLYAKTGP